MPIAQPKYDVALSFLSADESIAAALYNTLSAGLEVFFSPRKQEALAGTDGLESMRTPFLEDSRVVVVLFRELWGNTSWTGVEQTAIKDRCLKHGWQTLFFIMIDNADKPPVWLPHTHVRFNFVDFGIEQAVGAIKARVQESGGTIAPLSAMRRAQLSQQEQQYLQERRQLRSPRGRDVVQQEATELFGKINKLCSEIEASGTVSIQFASDSSQCHLRNDRVSLIVTLSQTYSATLSDTSSEFELKVSEFSKRLAFWGENLMYMDGKPKLLSEITFLPELNRARQRCWTKTENPSRFVSSDDLANDVLIQFINLTERRR
jgi:hypothetical protein